MRYNFIEVPNGKRRFEDDDEVDVFGMRKSLKSNNGNSCRYGAQDAEREQEQVRPGYQRCSNAGHGRFQASRAGWAGNGLPVIMLSGNGDLRLVMKGVTHGACDYLLKPVRFEELRNIWQHVIRRRKSDRKDRNNLDNQEESYDGGPDDGQNPAVSSPERNAKQVRKRKEQDEEEEGLGDEDGNENKDSTSQKKPRVCLVCGASPQVCCGCESVGN